MTDIKELIIDPNEQSGFYKPDGEDLAFAPNFVQFPDGFMLERADKDTYAYPQRGYYWFNTRKEALKFFNLQQDPRIDTTLPSMTALHASAVSGMPSEKLVNGPIPPDNDPDDDDQGILEKPDPYIPDVEAGCDEHGLYYDPGLPIDEADDCEPDGDPRMSPPPFA
jgi:hypothetical protein